ncbi:cupin domain-containing protein [Zavarzinella formosa]|uniref:cupin domain-containing protein n=1 Tax=Zavarzinella formosa TaxID=360055 RepID=UPI00031D0D36|nr:cupin domain-containing protein [Zavarzinella formosa]
MSQHAVAPSLDQPNRLPLTVSVGGPAVRDPATISPVPCPCGQSTRIITAKDGLGLSFHITEISEATRHYHRKTTEVYHIVEGTGRMELDGEITDIRPGLVISIPPGVRHCVTADDIIRTIVIAIPAFDPEDEFFD